MKGLLVGCLATTLVAQAGIVSAGVILFQESFDGYANDVPPTGWTESYFASGSYTREEAAELNVSQYITDSIYFGSSGKSLHVVDNSTTLASSLRHGFSSTTRAVMEYYLRPTNTTEGYAEIRLESDFGADYLITWDSTQFRIYFGGSWEDTGMEYTPGTWYCIERSVDFDKNEGYFLIENTGDASDYVQISHAPNPLLGGYVNRINIQTSNSSRADFHVDEILVMVPEPSAVALAALAVIGLTFLGWRRQTKRGAGAVGFVTFWKLRYIDVLSEKWFVHNSLTKLGVP